MPLRMSDNKQHIVMGQRKWKVQSGFPDPAMGGMSLFGSGCTLYGVTSIVSDNKPKTN